MNTPDLSSIHLALFLTRAVPLSVWERQGILERELALYLRLRPHLAGLTLVTCGGPEELRYQERLPGVRILHNRWGLSPNAYSLLAPLLHGRALRQATVYKTNQLDGAWTALLAGRLHRRPVIVRAGYLWALNFRRAAGRETLKGRLIRRLERLAFRRADCAVVTTPQLRDSVAREHGVPPERIAVVPNFVDTEHFRPRPEIAPEAGRVLFVGTFNSAKNLPALIEAIARLPQAHLVLIGDGPLRAGLEAQATALGARVAFAGRVPNSRLPEEIARAEVFVLPSHYEGHPKALIEALACGTAVVGTDVDGIRDVLRHEETGLLCPPTPEGIAAALGRLLDDPALRARLGRAAREFVAHEYSLEHVMEREMAVLAEVSR